MVSKWLLRSKSGVGTEFTTFLKWYHDIIE
nr:MAG TPA: hypothetical protein [Caudoviricetes sp.]